MKRFIAIWIVCTAAAIGSFAAIVAEDRQFGVPLPYSVPLGFAAMQMLGAGLLAMAEHLRANRPVVVRVVERRTSAKARRLAHRHPQGSVLLDLSNVAVGGQVA